MSQHISKKDNIVFPIGSNICTTHRQQEESDKSVANAENILDESVNSENDPDFTPSEIYLNEEEIEKSNRRITDIADILDASPVRLKLKKKKKLSFKKINEATTLLKQIC